VTHDLDALDLDARELAALAAFERETEVFADLGEAQPGDAALVHRMSAHAVAAGGGGAGIAPKVLALGVVVAGAIAIGIAGRSADDPAADSPPTDAPVVAEPQAVAAPPPLAAPAPAIDLEPAPVEPAPVVASRPGPPKRAAPPSITAAELLREANAARSAGEHTRARDLYLRLRREFPGSREDMLVRVSLGQLALEKLHDPALALRQFGAYLEDRPKGTLAEEASLGRIGALRKLGRAQEEARAIERFVTSFPDSIHVRTLQERRAALAE
jgi:hypothetical protein